MTVTLLSFHQHSSAARLQSLEFVEFCEEKKRKSDLPFLMACGYSSTTDAAASQKLEYWTDELSFNRINGDTTSPQ